MPHTQMINLKYMWLHALGLNSQEVDIKLKRNEGVWAPDGGPCKLKDTHLSKGCTRYTWMKIDSAQHLYNWDTRYKERHYSKNHL